MILNWKALTVIFPFFPHPANVEAILFDMAGEYSDDYTGGQWTSTKVGKFTIAVPPTDTYEVVNCNNYFEDSMDALSFGACLTLLLFNRLLWDHSEKGRANVNELSDQFYDLRATILNDPRFVSAKIVAFLD